MIQAPMQYYCNFYTDKKG